MAGASTHVMGRRVVAYLIDGLLAGVVIAAVFLALATKCGFEESSNVIYDVQGDTAECTYARADALFYLGTTSFTLTGDKAALFVVFELLLGALYFGILPGLTGWTPGKLVTGIRVVGEGGRRPPGVGRSILRWVLMLVDNFPYFIPMLVGFITALSSDARQRVGDRAARTYVVRSVSLSAENS